MRINPDYFDPIYIIEFDVGDLFPFRQTYYHETETDILRLAGKLKSVLRVIEKSMITGKEKIIKEFR